MIRHNIWSSYFRVAVIRKTDNIQVGTMPANCGMVLASGDKVTEVNEQSVLVEKPGCVGNFKESGSLSVYFQEAKKFGFIDKLAEEG